MDILQGVLVRSIFWLVCIIPVRIAGAIGAGLGRLIFYLLQRRRHIAISNLERVYPDRTDTWRQSIARESFAELGRTLFEVPHVFLRSKEFLQASIQDTDLDQLHDVQAQGKGAFILMCHYSNWEMCGIVYSTFVANLSCIYRTFKQPSLDDVVKQGRGRFGVSMQSRRQGLRWLPKALKNGQSILTLMDQHLSNGMPVPFMGHLANTSTLPATFVLKYGTPVFGMALHRIGRGFRFRLQLWRIEMPAATGDKDADLYRMTQRISESFEPMIHQRPELWLWSHHRWKWLEEHPTQEATDGTS